MKNKWLVLGLIAAVLLTFNPVSRAQAIFSDNDNVDAILEENALREVFTRYTSMLVFFQPEEASRLGFNAGNARLNDRSASTDTQLLQALENVRTGLQAINAKHLSPAKRVEYHLLQDRVERNMWTLQQNRLAQDPLYYAQALDAVYDLLLPTQESPRKQRMDLLGRLEALPQVYEQAQQNLTAVSPRLAQLAMEKAYYAYLSFDQIRQRLTNGGELTNDTRDSIAIDGALSKAQKSINDLFELFKRLSKQSIEPASALGAKAYAQKLQDYYQLDTKLTQLEASLNERWDEAQHQLFEALRPFVLSADESEVTIVDDLNLRPQEKLPEEKTKNTLEYTPPTANQFYAVAGQLVSPYQLDHLLAQFTQQANAQNAALLGQKTLTQAIPLQIQELTPYFSYQQAFLSYPAFPAFLIRTPQGNELAKTQMLNQDFNEPAVKLLISEEIVPGRYYQSQVQKSAVRRLFGSPLLANGWALYALRLAQQTQVFVTDEELLFLAWQRFVRTLSAVIDYRLHTQQYTYADTLNFLTEQNGFTTEQAVSMVDAILRAPGEAVTYVTGESIWQENAEKYLKKSKGNSNITSLLLETGNVSPEDLALELKRLYRK